MQAYSHSLYPVLLIAALTAIVPMVSIFFTSFLKISLINGLIRHAFGTQHAPGSIVTFALSVAMTFIVMRPVIDGTIIAASEINLAAPKIASIGQLLEIAKPSLTKWRDFLTSNVGNKEREYIKSLRPSDSADLELSWAELCAGFIFTEVKEGFLIGFILLLPFLVIDLVVANILIGLGIQTLSPTAITVPLKLLLFISTDAWLSLTGALVSSYK